ncbi:GNAT family N-acetyltransferase [Paractinoplanes durhamensis]|uniref:GNAT family N-acetyltransferase n=1 Tax=Paractinoplanes durhamensis TaxID=113563 RepID=UPI00194041DB|nr:GNAT family N-acetyltransferase [Actinoplanes durhamensis]
MTTTRLVAVGDAPELAALLVANRDFLAPWEPFRPAEFFTPDGQAAYLEEVLRLTAAGSAVPHVILDEDGRICGRITLSGIVRGPSLSADLGYWVAEQANGKGRASAAVAHICRLAFGELGLHRVEAGVQPHNAASQRVLHRNGFQRYGLAPRYLHIDGEWRDHVLFQLLSDD